MIMKSLKTILGVLFLACLVIGPGSCGSGSGPECFYSVDVVNETDAAITVRYDWNSDWWPVGWTGEATIALRSDKIIEWYSEDFTERIEAEYLGKKKDYTVASPMDIVNVRVQDFP